MQKFEALHEGHFTASETLEVLTGSTGKPVKTTVRKEHIVQMFLLVS